MRVQNQRENRYADAAAKYQAEDVSKETTAAATINEAESGGQQTAMLPEEQSKDRVLISYHEYAERKNEASTPSGMSAAQNGKLNQSQSNIQDKSGVLNRQMVGAKTTMELHSVTREALQELGSLRMAAAGDGDAAEKAQKIIKKLEKLVRRANKKVGQLNQENSMRLKQKRAEKKEQDELAQQIKKELKAKIEARKRKEQKYLQESEGQASKPSAGLTAAEQAQITMQANAIAAAEVQISSGADGSGGMGSTEIGGGVQSSGEAMASGGEAAPVEGESIDVTV